eukprot:m.188282 g.188282  ORF g.188282 m.188282 type:complete len:661 (+) comp25636_c0_seq7:121-2103(+)
MLTPVVPFSGYSGFGMLSRFCRLAVSRRSLSFRAQHEQSLKNPERFWKAASETITWDTPPKQAFQQNNVTTTWFPGGKLNSSFNCLDRHIAAGNGNKTAFIYDSPVTETIKHFSYEEVLSRVQAIAATLTELGVEKGDRVVIYMPMIPEAAFAMLATARIGAIHSVVFGGFASQQLAVRIDDARPKVILSASCGIEGQRVIDYKPLLDHAVELAEHKPSHCLILERPQSRISSTQDLDLDWETTVAPFQNRTVAPTIVDSDHPLYILYTSGTTGQPKGIVRESGGHAVALAWSMKNLYDIDPDDVWWAASDVGWVVGHSYIVYAPLLAGCTSVFFEGKPVGTPDAGTFFRVIDEHKVKALFTAPTVFRAIRQQDPHGELRKKYPMEHFETLYLAGERSDPELLTWAHQQLNVPVIDNYWQTETGWAICTNPRGDLQDVPLGSAGIASPGYDVSVVDEDGLLVSSPGELGHLVVKLPLPPSCTQTLWNKHDQFISSYLSKFPGFYDTGDLGEMDESGNISILSRADDLINVAAHRLSTGEMESAVLLHPSATECAVIGVKDEVKGQVPFCFVVLEAGANASEEKVETEIRNLVREEIGAIASLQRVVFLNRLPKTRSGKILRKTLRAIVNRDSFTTPATIEDITVLDEVLEAVYGREQEDL